MKKIFNIEISCLSIIVVFYWELNKENKIKWFELIIQYLVNYSMNLKRELMNFILLISHYLTQVYIEEIINISYIDKNEISKNGIMNILISLENHPNILQMMDYINNMIITLSKEQNYWVIMIVKDKI